jgi:hypothetical protein
MGCVALPRNDIDMDHRESYSRETIAALHRAEPRLVFLCSIAACDHGTRASTQNAVADRGAALR